MVIIIILALLYIVNITGVQIPTQISQPQFSTNKFPLLQTTTNTKKPITITFPDIKFQISSNFYSYNGTIQNQQNLHNPQSYTQQQLNCTLYKTSLNIHPISNIFYNQSIDNIKYTIDIRNNSMNILYILDSDSVLSVYSFNESLITIKNKYNIEKNITGINDNAVFQGGNVELFVVSGFLFLVNKDSMYYFNETNSKKFLKLNGYVGKNEIIDVGIIQQNKQITDSQIWIGTTRGVTTYTLMNTDQLYASKGKQQNGIISDTITAVTYSTQSQYFYITAGRTLYIVDLVNTMPILQYQLNSTCQHITKISQTLYISCQYTHINFIMQLHLQQNYQQLSLNKYYNDDTISGIRQVQYIGYKKIAIIGDQQAMIINQGTNRKLLLDLAKYNKQQNYQYLYSFSMYDFYYLQQYSTEQQVIILVIGSSQVALHKLVFQSPEIVCVFDQNSKVGYSILVVFNTTYCPITDNQNQQQIINTNFYCQSYYPIQIQINKTEYQEKTAKFIVVIIIGVLGIIIGLIVGCGCMIRKKANKIIQGLREKIQKVRLLHQQSEAKMI